jgi:hypothetical protein
MIWSEKLKIGVAVCCSVLAVARVVGAYVVSGNVAVSGFLPIEVVGVVVIAVVGILYKLNQPPKPPSGPWFRFEPDAMTNITYAAIAAGVLVFGVLVVVSQTCTRYVAIERFQTEEDPMTALLADISTAEAAVCSYMTQADQFIQSDIGLPGQNNPALVTTAQVQARTAVTGGVVVCAPEELQDDAANRLTRLENTLKSFTGPQFVKTYNRTVPCPPIESFVGSTDIPDLRRRLDTIQDTIAFQQTQYLTPISNMTAQLQRGQASDCQKQQGSKVAMSGH